MMGHTPPVPMTAAQFAAAQTGQSVQISVRVISRNRANISAELLQHQTASVGKRTGRRVELYFADGTPTIMGSVPDIKPGAILFVYGIVTKPGHVDVKRLVIDSRFVHVV